MDVIQVVSEILADKSDYYCNVSVDVACVGNRNVVIRLFDDYLKDSGIVKISLAIRAKLKEKGFDVSEVESPIVQVLDQSEGVLKRCVIIRTSQNLKKEDLKC
jgi:hypothetical protein